MVCWRQSVLVSQGLWLRTEDGLSVIEWERAPTLSPIFPNNQDYARHFLSIGGAPHLCSLLISNVYRSLQRKRTPRAPDVERRLSDCGRAPRNISLRLFFVYFVACFGGFASSQPPTRYRFVSSRRILPALSK